MRAITGPHSDQPTWRFRPKPTLADRLGAAPQSHLHNAALRVRNAEN